jgi:hypothetical protein
MKVRRLRAELRLDHYSMESSNFRQHLSKAELNWIEPLNQKFKLIVKENNNKQKKIIKELEVLKREAMNRITVIPRDSIIRNYKKTELRDSFYETNNEIPSASRFIALS